MSRYPVALGRRDTLRLASAAGAALFCTAHTPYQQWVVYRRRVLLVGSSRDDPAGYDLGRRIAETLARHLPESRSRVSRAPSAQRLASLIATDQMDVAVLPQAAGRALAAGAPPYADFGAVPLSLLYGFEHHLLVCRAEFPASHAYLVSRTLAETLAAEPGAALSMADPEGALALHPGSRDYLLGRPLPEAEDLAAGHGQPHDHGD